MSYTATEMMTIEASRALRNEDICFVGIGLPSAACNLARLTHAPRLTLVYESGTLETKPHVLPLSIGDGELAETALSTVPVPEMFQYWLQGAREDRVAAALPQHRHRHTTADRRRAGGATRLDDPDGARTWDSQRRLMEVR